MKFECDCGRIIPDQTDFLPNKASFFADQDDERVWTTAWTELGQLVTAARKNRTGAWAAAHLGDVPGDVDDEALVWQYLSRLRGRYQRQIYECWGCGRLHVERTSGGELVPFQPNSGQVEHVLRSSFGSPLDERATS